MINCNSTSKVKAFKGADATFDIILTTESKNLYDLTNTEEVQVSLLNNDGSVLTKSSLTNSDIAIVSPPTNGKISVTLQVEDTELLKDGNGLNIQVKLLGNSGQDVKIVQLLKVLDVIPSLF